MRARRGILSHPDFRRLWIADLLSQLGSRLLRTCETAAWLLLGLFAGAWVDRVRCLPVLVFADLGRAVLFASIPLAAAFGVLTLTQLYAVLALAGLLTVLFDVAHSSYPPRLLAPDQLLPGNAKLRSSVRRNLGRRRQNDLTYAGRSAKDCATCSGIRCSGRSL